MSKLILILLIIPISSTLAQEKPTRWLCGNFGPFENQTDMNTQHNNEESKQGNTVGMSKEEIFEKAFERAKIKYPNEKWKNWDEIDIEKELVYEALTEYVHQALDEAAENAQVECENPMDYPELQSYIVDKQSILELKEKY